jgi:membrane associated rhomboid family serine protease
MNRRARAPLPWASAALSAAIVAAFAVELAGDGQAICQALGFTPAHPSFGTAFASMWLHDPSNAWHVGGNVVALVLFGALVERELGHFRFVVLFALGGIGAAAFHVLANPGSLVPEVGASGAIFAVMAAAAMLHPRLVGFVASLAAFNVYQTIAGTGGEVATAAHLGGFVVGFALMLVVFGPRPASRRARRAGTTTIAGWLIERRRARQRADRADQRPPSRRRRHQVPGEARRDAQVLPSRGRVIPRHSSFGTIRERRRKHERFRSVQLRRENSGMSGAA